jgi:hypothetical protein
MTMRNRITAELTGGVLLIALAFLLGVSGPVVDNIALSVGIVGVAAGLILVVVQVCGHDIQEVADRYPWTASSTLKFALLALWLTTGVLGFLVLSETPAGLVLRHVTFGLLLLSSITPESATSSTSAERDESVAAK